jgi:broad-specificity NMP kinase
MIIFINGTLGVGKSSVTEYLLWNTENSVKLEGDALCNLNPFFPYDTNRINTLIDIIEFMISKYKSIGYKIFIIDNIFEKESEIELITNKLKTIDEKIIHFLLYCDKKQRNERIERRKRINYQWEMERSEELHNLLISTFNNNLNINKIDTTKMKTETVGEYILNTVEI